MGLLRYVVVMVLLATVGGMSPLVSGVAAQEVESEPVGMVAGQWRMLAWQVAVAPEFPEQELSVVEGGRWGVLIADITNTGVTTNFSFAEITLGGSSVDVVQSVRVSRALGFEGVADDGTVPVPENGTVRVALVSVIGNDLTETNVTLGGQTVNIVSVQVNALDLAQVPALAPAMQLEIGTISAVPNASTLSLAMQSGEVREVAVQGIQAPPAEGCYGPESIQLVNDATGGTVWVETIPGTQIQTVWFNDVANAAFGLLSFTLVSAGAADADGSGVYGEWLAPISDQMEAQKAGLWQNCRGAGGQFINPPTPTPVPTPSAEEIRKAYTWVDTRDLIARPFSYEGEKIAISGEVFTLQVTREGTFMQVWVDTPNGREAVVVAFPGSQTEGLFEGMWVTVYGVGAGTFEGTNLAGGVISQPLIVADIVDY